MPKIFFVLFVTVFATSCTSKKAPREVNLAIWGNYLSPELQKKFTDQTGVQIRVSNYSSNEELLAKIQSGASGIDVAVPSDYMVDIMIKTGVLQPLKKELLPNTSHLSLDWTKLSFDPDNTYSFPYAWSTTGIAIHKGLFKGQIKTWRDFFSRKDIAGKVSMLDDVREATGAALKSQGLSLNASSAEDLKKAERILMEMKPRLKMFRSDIIEALVNKEVAIAQAYSTDAFQAMEKTKGQVEFILPEDGGSLSVDNLVILKGAKNVETAHALINFMLSPEVNLSFVSQIRGGPVLKETRAQLPPDLKNNPAMFPPTQVLKKFEGLRDLGSATALYDQLWTKVKSE